ATRDDKVTGKERVAAETGAVDAADEETALPDQFIAPVGPPASAGRRRGRRRLLWRRRKRSNQDRDQDEREAPKRERPAPGTAHERHDERDRQHHDQRFADEQPVGVNRRPEADPSRQPSANERRQRRLQEPSASTRHNGE